MTFGDQLDFLSELIGDPNSSTDDAFPLARRKAAINRGDIQFCRDAKCIKEYATDTVADSQLVVPSGWLKTFQLTIDNKVIDDWRQIDLHQWERFQSNGINEPFFYLWTFSGVKTMKFLAGSGVNGLTYKLYYFKKQTTALSDVADESIIPDEHREGPVYWAAAHLLRQVGQTVLAAKMYSDRDAAGLLLPSYMYHMSNAKVQAEEEHIQTNRPNPDMGDAGEDRGGYNQGDGGYLGRY